MGHPAVALGSQTVALGLRLPTEDVPTAITSQTVALGSPAQTIDQGLEMVALSDREWDSSTGSGSASILVKYGGSLNRELF